MSHVLPSRPLPSREERTAWGRHLRHVLPRSAHEVLLPPEEDRNVLATLRAGTEGCLPHLVPLRFGRMAASPFAFFRGTAGRMAADLARTPVTGERVQASGDAHCANFGAFATGERHLVFDLNDFDETLRAPWEWDIKRLAASLVLAGRTAGHTEREARASAQGAVRAYRLHTRTYATLPHLDVWYDRIDASEALADMGADTRRHGHEMFSRARERTHLHTLRKLAERTPNGWRLRDDPPLLVHTDDPRLEGWDVSGWLDEVRGCYLDTVPPDRRALLARYHLADWAMKVTGVGSCGRRVLVLLLAAEGDDVIFLQAKEARSSVLEPFAGAAETRSAAHRVVFGQQLMQSATDPFLGWATCGPHTFYVRQLRDMKGRFDLERVRSRTLEEIGELCGWALARAHARTGDAAVTGAYMGGGERFDCAVTAFAAAYADQAERDHAQLVQAIRGGEIEAEAHPED